MFINQRIKYKYLNKNCIIIPLFEQFGSILCSFLRKIAKKSQFFETFCHYGTPAPSDMVRIPPEDENSVSSDLT